MAKSSPFSERSSHRSTDAQFTFAVIRKFVAYFRPHIGIFIADLFCAVFLACVDLVFPMLSRHTINVILPAGQYRLFAMVVVLGAVIFVLHSLAHYFMAYFGHMFGVYVEKDMRRDIFSHIERQSFAFFDENRTGKLMSRVTYDLFEISELAHHGPEDLLISGLTICGSLVIMAAIKPEMAAVLLCAVAVLLGFTISSKSSLMRSSRGVKEKTAEINAGLESSISGARVTKVFTNEAYEAERFARLNGEFVGAKRLYYRAMAFYHSKMDFSTHIMPVVVLAVGGFFIMQGTMRVGDLVAANLFVAAFLQPIRRLTNFMEQFTTGMAGFQRFVEIMDTHEETPQKPGAVEAQSVRGDIEFRNVSFAYRNGQTVLKNFNLKVKAGQTVALVGPSGSGKTTLCSLIPRFYDCTSGSITLDGRDITEYTVESLRRNVGVVQQDVFLFAGTIKENIAYGRIGSSDAEIARAAELAEIADDIAELPQQFETVVGERGQKLSGGQKQRVSIARVFLKNPPVLILDEATSALDSATEVKIQRSFDRLAQGRTTFVIAHRLSTVRNADVIAVVDGEGIVESGTHDELMELRGEYYALYTAQYGVQGLKQER